MRHIHNKPLHESFDPSKHINVSVDVINFTPVELVNDEIKF